MPTDKTGVSNLTIVDLKTRQETRIDTTATLTMTTDETSQHEPFFGWDKANGTDFSATIEIKDQRALRELLYKSFTVTGSIDEITRKVFLEMPLGRKVVHLDFKQNKAHKKKRINKKWKKRYGYTCKVFYAEGEFI